MDHGLDIKVSGIASLLDDRPLEVPAYQRPYAWEADHVDAFWRDLADALNRRSNYFLGSVVLSNAEDRHFIVDGQQRVATTALLLCAIRDYFRARGDEDSARVILHDHLARRRLSQAQLVPRLRLGKDDGYFQSLLVRERAAVPRTDSEKRLQEALNALSTRLNEDLEAANDAAARCDEWIDFLRSKALVIRVAVSSDADAFLIFETLNDRGVPLTTTDLLRNYLLSRLPAEGAGGEAEEWDDAIGAVTAVGDSQTPVTFIRHYWSGREGATRERDLYRSIRKAIQTEDEAKELVKEVSAAAHAYAALLDPTHGAWSDFSPAAASLASVLSHLELARVRPLVLALMLSQVHGDEMFDALARWLPRGLLSNTIGGSVAERAFASAAQGVRRGELKTLRDLRKTLSALLPGDERFAQSFAAYRLRRPQLGSYVLAALQHKNPSPFRDRRGGLTDWTVVPVFSPGLVQQLAADATSDEQRQLDGLRESFANFVLVEGKSAQTLKGASGEVRIQQLKKLCKDVEMPNEVTPATALIWLSERLQEMQRTAIQVWNTDV